jgi:hypothetical protein
MHVLLCCALQYMHVSKVNMCCSQKCVGELTVAVQHRPDEEVR